MKYIFLTFFFCSLCFFCSAQGPLVPLDGLMKLKGAKEKNHKVLYRQLLFKADSLMELRLSIPPRGGVWTHYYVSPKDGSSLIIGKQIAAWRWEHMDRKGNVFYGDSTKISTDYDGIVIEYIHGERSNAVLILSFAYQLTHKKKYAEKAFEIVAAYARKYNTWPLRCKKGMYDSSHSTGNARIHSQALNESVWLIPILQGLSIISTAIPKDSMSMLKEKLIAPILKESIMANRMGVHNIQCWHNAAIGLSGLLFQDTSWINRAIRDPKTGFNIQVRKGLTKFGHWYEMAPSYHFYALQPMLVLTNALAEYQLPQYREKLRPMLLAPLRLMAPDYTLPSINDSRKVNLRWSFYRLFYQWGAKYFPDQEFRRVLSLKEAFRTQNGTSLFGMQWLFPYQQQKGFSPPVAGSFVDPDAGVDVFKTDSIWLMVKYDRERSFHYHPDQLSIVAYYGKKQFLGDPGITGYASDWQGEWFRHTLSHQTVVYNRNYQRSSSVAKCLGRKDLYKKIIATYQLKDSVNGILSKRTICIKGSNILIIKDQIACPDTTLNDIAFHFNEASLRDWVKTKGPTMEWTDNPRLMLKGFNRLEKLQTLGLTKYFSLESKPMSFRQKSKSSFEVFHARSKGENYIDQATYLNSGKGNRTVITVFSPYRLKALSTELVTQFLEE